MPVFLRASHEAAGHAGLYPHNGALRLSVERSCAARLVTTEKGWAEIKDCALDAQVEDDHTLTPTASIGEMAP